VKPYITSVEVYLQLRNNGHPVDGALVGAGSTWPKNSNIPTTAQQVIRSISALQTVVKLCVCVCFFLTSIIYLFKFLN
jgi:hypothetical protein